MKILVKIKALFVFFTCLCLTLICFTNTAQARSSTSDAYISPVYRSMTLSEIKASKETCIQCHQRVTPKEVAHYNKSSHKKIGLDCSGCHGKDHSSMPFVTGKTVCIKCHAKQTQEMLKSNHAKSWVKMWDNARYLSISKPMRMQGCVRCHDISVGFSDVRCDYCHSTHEFSVQEAKNPAACSTCHMGPDHPQAEAYEAAGHGKAFAAFAGSQFTGSSNGTSNELDNKTAKDRNNITCVTCHQQNGSHNVSVNIGIGGVSNGGILEDWHNFINEQGKPKLKRKLITKENFEQARLGNLKVCNNCHSQDFNNKWLTNADQLKFIIEEKLLKAEEIVKDLDQEDLLYPSPKQRPGNPVEGQKLVLGGNQIYVGTSKAEAIYFQMYKFAAAQGWKSAYHQNFNRAGLEGMRVLDDLMKDLEKEAKVLKLTKDINLANQEAVTNTFDMGNENLDQPAKINEVNRPVPNYLRAALVGILFSSFLVLILKLLAKKQGTKYIGWFVFIILINLGLFLSPSQALAWGDNPQKQSMCVTCHDDNSKELAQGPHKSLKCLNCHEANAKIEQVRNPEVCRKCHSGSKGYQWESYITSPHGVQYRIKGEDPWVPTCVTCHVQKGDHSLRTQMGDNRPFTGDIGEVCLKCHTNDEVLKFNKDLTAINVENQTLVREFEAIGDNLVREGILINKDIDMQEKNQEVDFQWWKAQGWQVANIEKLSPEEQTLTAELLKRLIDKSHNGAEVNSQKLRSGVAHLNPDYTHWYGYAYQNLALSDVASTSREIQVLANKAKLIADRDTENFRQELYVGFGSFVGSFILIIIFNRLKFRRNKGQ